MQAAIEKMMFENIKTIHFVGIGGIGMSGIAEILHNLGYAVQGSDLGENDNVLRLRNLGIKVITGHISENIDINISVVVKSTAVSDENPEILAARKLRIPVIKRSEMLAELMRLKISIGISGTHGKTTTTAFVAALFEEAALNPTVINGGIINRRGTNAYLGQGDYIIAEADESDGTFIRIPSTIAVITNIDPEHLDYYKNFENLKEAYRIFIHNLPFYGFAVVCKDHANVAELIKVIQDREVITYGIDAEDLDIKAINIEQNTDGSVFDIMVSERVNGKAELIKQIILPVPGRHNILNAMAAISIGVKLKFKVENIIQAFVKFEGVKRRFTKTGIVNSITIIDDYAHHPEEIKATLQQTAKQVSRDNSEAKIIAIFQPHRYSRLENLFSEFVNCFADADIVYIADIYSAGEDPIDGISKEVLVSAIRQNYKNKEIFSIENQKKLASVLIEVASPGDMIVFLGAGSITKWAYDLPIELKNLLK